VRQENDPLPSGLPIARYLGKRNGVVVERQARSGGGSKNAIYRGREPGKPDASEAASLDLDRRGTKHGGGQRDLWTSCSSNLNEADRDPSGRRP
jgi:hypothetical protein